MTKDKNTAIAEIVDEPIRFGGELNIDKDDIIAVAVTEAEQRMRKAKEAALGLQTTKLKEAESKEQAAEDAVKDDFAKRTAKQVDQVTKMFHAIGIDLICSRSSDINTSWDYTGEKSVQVSKDYVGHLKFSEDPEGRRHKDVTVTYFPEFQFVFPVRASVRKTMDQSRALAAEASEAGEGAMEWKRRLSRIPQLERMYKARLAARSLEKTKPGQEVLAQLTGSLDDDILALPSS